MDEPILIEGIVEGDPETLAAVCAAGGSAVLAYCQAVGAHSYVAETMVAALGEFRRGVVADADQEPSQLQHLLVAVTDSAARQVAGVDPSASQQTAAQAALEVAVASPLAPGLAPRIISALVQAAPVTALRGDAAAVQRATEQHYMRMFDLAPAPAPAPAESTWLPPELADHPAPPPTAHARVATPSEVWDPPADLFSEAIAPAPPAPPPAPLAPDTAAAVAATPPTAPTLEPQPGALVIQRGGHWPFRRRTRRPARAPGTRGRGGYVLIAALIGLAVGGAIGVLAAPERTAQKKTTLVRQLDVPFTVNGAVFSVARTRVALWALDIRRQAPRPGHSWLTLAAQTRNISRANYRPRALGYRLRTPTGLVIGPDRADLPPDVTAEGGRVAVGKRSSVHLGFQIPTGQRDLTLEFDPAPDQPPIRVPLN